MHKFGYWSVLLLALAGCELLNDGGSDAGGADAGDGTDAVLADGATDDGGLADSGTSGDGAAADAGPDMGPAVQDPESGALRGITAAHNVVRARIATNPSIPPLTWDPALAAYAQEWADELARLGCDLNHRPRDGGPFDQKHGENLFAGTGTYTPTEVVEAWASEEAFYNYANNSCTPGEACGHFTQVVWRDSARVGCAIGNCERWAVWVCNYDPPGNYIGRKPY